MRSLGNFTGGSVKPAGRFLRINHGAFTKRDTLIIH